MNPNETDSYNYYTHQLRRWFLIPDISLESRIGDHEYGSVIWALYMTERFGYDIIRQFYGNTTDGRLPGDGKLLRCLYESRHHARRSVQDLHGMELFHAQSRQYSNRYARLQVRTSFPASCYSSKRCPHSLSNPSRFRF